MKQRAIGFSVAFAIAFSGLRLSAGAPQKEAVPTAVENGAQHAPIDLPAGASPRYTVVPLHGATDADVAAAGAAGATIPMWSYTTTSSRDGHSYSGTMVGSASPFTSPNTTTSVTTPIIPLIINMPDGGIFNPTGPDPCAAAPLTNTSDLSLFLQSPILVSHAYTMNGVSVGSTQYDDAFQRASFWSLVGGQNYHVLLSPTTLSAITLNVPSGDGATVAPGSSGRCGNIGKLDINWFASFLEGALIPSLAAQGVSSTTFPMFLLGNVVMTDGGVCCILGYHGAYGSAVQTYAVSNFDTSGAFGIREEDTNTLAHEVGEWMADPLGTNPTPAWGNTGQVSGCQTNLEVGDPLTGTNVPDVTMPNGYTYHLQELAFFSWFMGAPSLGAGGEFSNNGTFVGNAPPCPAMGPPSITMQPSNQTVSPGSNVQFTVAASGAPAPTFQWQLSTNGGAAWSNLSNTSPYSGATTTALMITGVSSGLDGEQYRAVATNAGGSATSNAATLTVATPVITLVVPGTGQPRANLNVAVKGHFTHFVQGQTTASFGTGITVNSTTVTDPAHATVTLTVAGNAALGARTVLLTTGAEAVTLTNGFTVTAVPVDTQPVAYVVGRRLSPSQGGTNGIQTVSVIDTSTNAIVTTIAAGQGCFCIGPDGVAITPDGALAYVTNELGNTVSVIRTASNSIIATIGVGTGPTAVAVSPDGEHVYVLNGSGTTSVSVISSATNTTVATIPLGVIQARGMSIVPDGTRLYVATYGSNSVKVINTATNSVVNTIGVGHVPVGVDVTPDGSLVYVPNYLANSVSVISTATNSVVATINNVGTNPNSARITPDGTRAYVVSSDGVYVINTQTNSVMTTVAGAGGGSTLEFTPDGERAYVATYSSVEIINAATNVGAGVIVFDNTANGGATAIAMTPGATRVISLSGNLAFGTVPAGSGSSRTLTIANTGNSSLTVNSITFPKGFSGNWAGGTIAAGALQSVTVTFTSASPGGHGGTVVVNANPTSGTPMIAASGVASTRDGDFDGDGKADVTVYRPANGTWYVLRSSTSYTAFTGYQWGVSTDKPVPGDYDGDGQINPAVYRPSTGQWFILTSGSHYTSSLVFSWGVSTDIPVPGDYDGDGKSDLAVYRPSTGQWFILTSASNYMTGAVFSWGVSTDVPVSGDYDGDGKADLAVYRPSTGQWFILTSGSGYTAAIVQAWGVSTDVPLQGDYDGDGRADLAVYRPATGQWFILTSGSSYTTGEVFSWGVSTDIPVPGDYDGDGKADLAVYRPGTGQWFILTSGSNYMTGAGFSWGVSTDTPINVRP